MKITLSSSQNSNIDICSDRKLSDSDNAKYVVPVIEIAGKLEVSLHCLNSSAAIPETSVSASYCEMLLRNLIGSNPDLVLAREQFS